MAGGMPVQPGDPDRIGNYRVTSRLGEGGQGVVYLAEDQNGQHYAIKVLRAQWLTDSSARRRLAQEVAAAAQVSPFCTARLVEATVQGPEPYLVTEYVRGPTLATFVAEHGTLSGTDLHRLAIGMATALVAIHQAGVVHRDLKPSNVILSPQGPRVIDFGIARELTAPVTMTDRVIGTPMYMAPEQVRAEAVGPPADLFSWASTVTFAATARAPFSGPSLAAIVHRLATREPDLSGVESPLSEILGQCLAKDPQDRPTAQQTLLMLLGQPLPKKDTSDPTGLLTEALSVATITAEAAQGGVPGAGKGKRADPGATVRADPGATVRADPGHVPTVVSRSASNPTRAFPGQSASAPPPAPLPRSSPRLGSPPRSPAPPPRGSTVDPGPSRSGPAAVRPAVGAGPIRSRTGSPGHPAVPSPGVGYPPRSPHYRQPVRPAVPMPFTPRTSSDTRNSAIVVAIVILTTALVVVLGLVFLALAKNSQAVPRGPGESGGQVLLAVRDAPVPGAYSLDQLSKECSGPGNLPSLTSS